MEKDMPLVKKVKDKKKNIVEIKPEKKNTSQYFERLKDPRWQKMRLKVYERDDFHCQSCGDEKKQLDVHHLIYNFGTDPWDYDIENLITLCTDCHKQLTDDLKDLNRILRLKMTSTTISSQLLIWLRIFFTLNHRQRSTITDILKQCVEMSGIYHKVFPEEIPF